MQPSQNKPLIAIVKPKVIAEKDPTYAIKLMLDKALKKDRHTILVWDDADEAKQALSAQKHDMVFVVDQILPDGVGDTFIQWLNALSERPEIFIVLSVKGTKVTELWPSLEYEKDKEIYYDLTHKGYIPTLVVRDEDSLFPILLPYIKRAFGSDPPYEAEAHSTKKLNPTKISQLIRRVFGIKN